MTGARRQRGRGAVLQLPTMLRPRKGQRAQRYRPCSATDSRLARELRRTLPPALRRMLR